MSLIAELVCCRLEIKIFEIFFKLRHFGIKKRRTRILYNSSRTTEILIDINCVREKRSDSKFEGINTEITSQIKIVGK